MQISLAETPAASTTVGPPAASKRLNWIENLRGLAVSAVFLHHLLPHPTAINPGSPVYLDLGVFGVAVFFCISGYVIPYSAMRVKENPAFRFFVTRVFRLYPAYWLSLILGAAVLGASARQFIVNTSMLQRFVGVQDIEGSYWTLQVEIVFYFVIWVLLLTRKVQVRKLYPALSVSFGLSAIALASIRYYVGKKAPIAPSIGLTLMFAATTYYLHVSNGFLSKPRMRLFLAVISSLLAVSLVLGYSRDWGYQETSHRFFAMYPLAIACFLLFSKVDLDNPFLRFMGNVSYPVYLIHVPVIALLSQWFGASLNAALRYGLIVAVTLAGSLLMHNFMENPGIELGRRVLAARQRAQNNNQ